MKRVAIVQSNYVPWRGYFDLISSVDEFILLDDVQYTIRDWRNRNRITTPEGVPWLTIPAEVRVRWFEYPAYPEYPQLHAPFEPRVSILDLLFHTGEQAPRYLRANPDGALALTGKRE